MKITKRIIESVLHDNPDKFKTILKEEIKNRANDALYDTFLSESETILNLFKQVKVCEETNNTAPEHTTNAFYPNKMYKLKDGNVGILEINEQEMISKLYENLNNDNKERMVKLLSESRDSFNRVLKLARLEESKRTKQ